MRGTYFCDVCSIEFPVDTNDAHAVCPGCGEDVIALSDGFADPIDDIEADVFYSSKFQSDDDETTE